METTLSRSLAQETVVRETNKARRYPAYVAPTAVQLVPRGKFWSYDPETKGWTRDEGPQQFGGADDEPVELFVKLRESKRLNDTLAWVALTRGAPKIEWRDRGKRPKKYGFKSVPVYLDGADIGVARALCIVLAAMFVGTAVDEIADFECPLPTEASQISSITHHIARSVRYDPTINIGTSVGNLLRAMYRLQHRPRMTRHMTLGRVTKDVFEVFVEELAREGVNWAATAYMQGHLTLPVADDEEELGEAGYHCRSDGHWKKTNRATNKRGIIAAMHGEQLGTPEY